MKETTFVMEETTIEHIRNRFNDFMNADSTNDNYIESGTELLAEIRHSGQLLSDPVNRNLATQMARDIAGTLFELTGDYLPVRLEASEMIRRAVHTSSSDINMNPLAPTALQEWLTAVFPQSEAPEYMRSSWAGWVIWFLSAAMNRLTPQRWLTFLIAITLWLATAWLITPILQWPLNDPQTRLRACASFAIASVAIPLIIGSVSQADNQPDFQLKTTSQRWLLWFLKMTGALVAFNVFVALVLLLSLGFYYLTLTTLPAWVWWLLLLVPLMFGYVGARRVPADRYKMFNNELRAHEADRLFFVVFLLFSPLLAGFVYFFYGFLSDRITGAAVLLTMIGLALWDKLKHLFRFLLPQKVFLIGVLIACILAILLTLFDQFLYASITIIGIGISLLFGVVVAGLNIMTSSGNPAILAHNKSLIFALIISFIIVIMTLVLLFYEFAKIV